jgi:O-antigen/teichoic acid export membrane protein
VLGSITFSAFALFSVVYLCSNGAQGICLAILNISGRRGVASFCSIFDSLLKLVLVCFVFSYFGGEMIGVLISVAASASIVCFFSNWYFSSCIRVSNFSVVQFKPRLFLVLAKSLPLFLPVFLSALKGVGDRWVLAAYIGVDELAAFTVLLQIGYFPIVLLVGVIQTFIAPKVYALSSCDVDVGYNKLKRFLSFILVGIFILAFIGGGVSILLAGYIFDLFVSKSYGVYAIYLVFFVISAAVTAAGSILHLAVIGIFNSKIAGRLMLISVVFGVFVALTLIIIFGFMGAVAAMLVTSLFSTLLYYSVLYFDVFWSIKGRSFLE